MSVWLWVLYVSLGFWGGFAIWRRIKEEYSVDEGIQLVVASWFGGVVGGWLARELELVIMRTENGMGVPIWGILIGIYVSQVWFHASHKRWWGDVQDATMEALFWMGGIWLITELLITYSLLGVLKLVGWALFGGVVYLLKKQYRTFLWYKSGKVGFVYWGGTLLLLLISLGFNLVYGIGGWFRLAILLVGLLWAVVGLYRLSGRELSSDIAGLLGVVRLRG